MTSAEGVRADVAVDVRADVGEGPHWDAQSMSLWFVDLTAGIVYRWDYTSRNLASFAVGHPVGAVIPRVAGGIALAVRDGIAAASESGGDFELRCPIEVDNTQTRMNDAKCDPAGRMFAGTTAFDFAPGAAALYRVDPDWSCEAVVRGVTTSNGTAWSPDGSRMYFIDSGQRRVDVFDYDVTLGSASNRRQLVSIDETAGVPDGMTVDAEGNLWVACFGGGAVRCYSPGGEPITLVELPVSQVTSCAFGGPDYGDLYVTSARYQLSSAQLAEEPLAGATFVCRPGAIGRPASRFAG